MIIVARNHRKPEENRVYYFFFKWNKQYNIKLRTDLHKNILFLNSIYETLIFLLLKQNYIRIIVVQIYRDLNTLHIVYIKYIKWYT